MQWCVEVSSFSFPNNNLFLFIITMTFAINGSSLSSSSVHSLCSSFLFFNGTDILTNNHYVQPCPAPFPCTCICEIETKRLWIDCFHRQLTSFPRLKTIETKGNLIEWNIDLAFNRIEHLTTNQNRSLWIPTNMHIHHLILSGSLAYDLIVQLNLTHRHLIDIWPSQQHLPIADDRFQFFDDIDNQGNDTDDEEYTDVKEEEEEETKRSPIDPQDEHARLLAELTTQLREKTLRLVTFNLSLAGILPPVSNLYLDHNALSSVPIEALFNATGVYEIYLSSNDIVELTPYAFGFSHRLTRLDLSHNRITTIHNLTFQRHPEAFAGPFLIDYLDLSHNQLTILETSLFSYLVNLRLLKLQHNQIRSISPHTWTGLYRLKYLDLSHNNLNNFTQTFYSSYLSELHHLKITANNISQLGSCEFLTLKSLIKLNLNGNNLTKLDTCSFYGLRHHTSHHSPLNVYLRANRLETLHPCTFVNFARSTIHIGNNPLVCNCSFNYLLYDRQSLAYTGQECRGGFAYQPQVQLAMPAVRKSKITTKNPRKKSLNVSITCRDAYKYYKDACAKLDCMNICSPNERFIIQVTTIPTPSRTESIYAQTYLFVVLVLIVVLHRRFFLLYKL